VRPLDEKGLPVPTPSDPTLVLEFQGAGIPGPYVRDLAPQFSNGGCERRLVREWIAGYYHDPPPEPTPILVRIQDSRFFDSGSIVNPYMRRGMRLSIASLSSTFILPCFETHPTPPVFMPLCTCGCLANVTNATKINHLQGIGKATLRTRVAAENE